MGYIRNIWCLVLLFVVSFAHTQSIDSLTTVEHTLTGRYSITSTTAVNDTVYLVEGKFYDYRPITNPYTVDSIAVGMYMWSDNCAKWLIDSIGTKSGSEIQLKVKGTSSNPTPSKNHGAIINYVRGFPSIPVGISAHLTTCIWDDFSAATGNSSGGGTTNFDSNRPILRVPTAGINIGGSTVNDWLEWWYFTPPTISIASVTTPVEVGTSNALSISSTTSNSGGATLSNGYLVNTTTNDTLRSFTSSLTADSTITFTPQQGGSGVYNELTYSFRSTQDWVSGADSGTATSNTRTVQAVYPVFHFMSATDYRPVVDGGTGANIYSVATKLVQTEGNKTVTLAGTNQFIYYAVPSSWSDPNLSSIIDPNGFDILGGFTVHNIVVTSVGLTNNYTSVAYKLYKLNNLTTVAASPAQNYTFNR